MNNRSIEMRLMAKICRCPRPQEKIGKVCKFWANFDYFGLGYQQIFFDVKGLHIFNFKQCE